MCDSGPLGADVYHRVLKFGLLTTVATLLAGCVLFDDTRRLGPDEFGVVSRAPLSQPPDFALRPPRTGEKRPNEVTPREDRPGLNCSRRRRQRGTPKISSPKDGTAADGFSSRRARHVAGGWCDWCGSGHPCDCGP